MVIAISRTGPFRRLQGRIGSATYRLNTILVGLELVADGGEKPRELPVRWPKPSTREKARQVANQAEIFACTAALVLAADVFDQFLRDLVTEDWLAFAQNTREIATKAKTRPKNEGGDYSVAERTEALFADLKLCISPALGAVELLSKWRNVAVHSSERSASLDPRFEELMRQSKAHFHDHYSHFDIELAIGNFSNRKTPVPKEATSLIAAVQNVSRKIDETAIKRVAGTAGQILSAADHLFRSYLTNPERKQSAWSEISEAWQGSDERRYKNLLKIMERIGLTHSEKGISAPLPPTYIDELLRLTRSDFAQRFNISAS